MVRVGSRRSAHAERTAAKRKHSMHIYNDWAAMQCVRLQQIRAQTCPTPSWRGTNLLTAAQTAPCSRPLCKPPLARAYSNNVTQDIFIEPLFLVGSDGAADLQLAAAAGRHAELTQKGKQVFLKALVGEFVLDSTSTWIDGEEARSQVAYVLASGSRVAFGSPDTSYTITFDEPSGSNPLVQMLMQGMAAGASKEVQDALGNTQKS